MKANRKYINKNNKNAGVSAVQDTWKTYDVLILNNLSAHKIFSMSHSDYQILKFAYRYDYTVYFEISYSFNDDISIVENSVNILNR